MNKGNFSVLLSVYLKTDVFQLTECINSIEKQSLLPSEIILIVDGPISFDVDLFVKRYERLKFEIIRNKFNLGLPLSLNKGLNKCKYEIVFRIDSDDICLHNRFEIQLEKFKKNSKLAVLGTNVMLIDNKSCQINKERKIPLSNSEIRKILPFKNPFNHPSVVYKKSVILAVGGYSNVYLYEDWYLWFKISKLNDIEFENLNEKLIKYRIRQFDDRKGFKIIKAEANFYLLLLKNKHINILYFIINVSIKFCVRLMPSKIYIYIKSKFDLIN
ncbi:glycosyltransferase [Flavobacteriaceae bacterium]|nr:glycosyltransferase [Flavobacteriaceae bacterium]